MLCSCRFQLLSYLNHLRSIERRVILDAAGVSFPPFAAPPPASASVPTVPGAESESVVSGAEVGRWLGDQGGDDQDEDARVSLGIQVYAATRNSYLESVRDRMHPEPARICFNHSPIATRKRPPIDGWES